MIQLLSLEMQVQLLDLTASDRKQIKKKKIDTMQKNTVIVLFSSKYTQKKNNLLVGIATRRIPRLQKHLSLKNEKKAFFSSWVVN